MTVLGGMMMETAAALIAKLLRFAIRAYQLLLAPVLPGSCRYWPSCSEYAREAIADHGPFAGGLMALRRILRCHPWGGAGVDPVPPASTDNPAHAHRCAAGHRG